MHALFFALLLCTSDLDKQSSAAPTTATDFGWRTMKRCGPNCLYVLLRLSGESPDYEEVVSQSNVTERGANVAGLVQAAQAHGMTLTALRAEASALDQLPLPAIAHFNTANLESGHFVLLLDRDAGGALTIMDCTQGEIERLSRGDFLERWSGVVLVDASGLADYRDDLLVGTSGVALFLAAGCLWQLRNRRGESTPAIA